MPATAAVGGRVPAGFACIVAATLSIVASAEPKPAATPRPRGIEVFAQNCAVCHKDDGSGTPGTAPSLQGSAIPAGDPATLANLLLRGAAAALPAKRPPFENDMPTFEPLSDDEIAAVMSYVRRTFGPHARPITPAQVKAWRK